MSREVWEAQRGTVIIVVRCDEGGCGRGGSVACSETWRSCGTKERQVGERKLVHGSYPCRRSLTCFCSQLEGKPIPVTLTHPISIVEKKTIEQNYIRDIVKYT
jgi:hypothetical protein